MAQTNLKGLVLVGLLLLTSCFSSSALMTYSKYNHIETGTSIEEIQSRMGAPYAIHPQKDDSIEYEYIERIQAGDKLVVENHYFLIVHKGKVVGKYMTRERARTYDLLYQDQPNYPSN